MVLERLSSPRYFQMQYHPLKDHITSIRQDLASTTPNTPTYFHGQQTRTYYMPHVQMQHQTFTKSATRLVHTQVKRNLILLQLIWQHICRTFRITDFHPLDLTKDPLLDPNLAFKAHERINTISAILSATSSPPFSQKWATKYHDEHKWGQAHNTELDLLT